MARTSNTSNATPSGSRPAKTGRPSNGGSTREKKPARLPSSDEESDSGDEGGLIKLVKFEKVLEQYLNQPVDGEQAAAKVKTIINNLKPIIDNLVAVRSEIAEAAKDIASATQSPDGEEENEKEEDDDKVPEDPPKIKALDNEYRVITDKISELYIRVKRLDDLRQKLMQGHVIKNLYQAYEKSIEAPLAEHRNKTSRQRFLDCQDYIDFRDELWVRVSLASTFLSNCLHHNEPSAPLQESMHDGKAVPNVKKFIAAESGDEEDDEDEIEIGAQQFDFKCPITLMTLKDPMTSTKCPHNFSAAAIREMLGEKGAKCPISGCSQFLKWGDMEPNPSLKRRVDMHLQREQDGRGTQSGANGRTATQFTEVELSDDEDED